MGTSPLDPKSNQNSGRNFSNDEFEVLLKKHCEKAYNFAWRLVGNGPDAWDLLQEALMKAYTHFNSYDKTRPFDSWLMKILQNIYLDALRKNSRQPLASLDSEPSTPGKSWEEILPHRDPHPLENLSQIENLDFVQQALNSLPPLYKTAVVLCDMENLSYDEISKVMDCPIGTVRSRVHQGRLLLKKAFDEREKKSNPERQFQ